MNSLAADSTVPVDDKREVARRLAESHRAIEPEISHIYVIESPGRESDPAEPIKLL